MIPHSQPNPSTQRTGRIEMKLIYKVANAADLVLEVIVTFCIVVYIISAFADAFYVLWTGAKNL